MSFGELLIILLVAIIVIKPERLPEISYLLGKTLGRIRHWYQMFQEKYMRFM